jgi:uncharacterized protein (TIGR03435 family)
MKPLFASLRRSPTFLNLLGVLALSIAVTAQTPLEFEVSSIKRNLGTTPGGDVRRLPDGTFIATNISIRNVLGSAWPTEDFEYRNLPDWAIRNRYDITVKPPAGASQDEIQAMWRALFRDRFKLQVHNETRDTPIYALVVARGDRRLGPQIKPSAQDCAALAAVPATPSPPRMTLPSEDQIMATCGSLFQQGRMIVGGALLSTFARTLSGGVVGRIVEDRTGLEGYYALTLTYSATARPGADVPADPGDAPSIFTALTEQLGLKLEPARKSLQTVVIDHIEPPTEN